MAKLVLGKVQQVRPTAVVSADMETVYEAIDLRLKEIHRLGIYWRNVDKVPLSFSIPAATNSASASVDILFPISMTVLDGSVDSKVEIIGVRQYAEIPNKSDAGIPTKALWKGGAEFIFHPIPRAVTTANLVYEKFADDTAAATAPDVEVSMLRWLKDIIAYDVGDQFGIPEAKMVRWEREATRAEKNIRKLAVERVDDAPAPVSVDNWGNDGRETDYGR